MQQARYVLLGFESGTTSNAAMSLPFPTPFLYWKPAKHAPIRAWTAHTGGWAQRIIINLLGTNTRKEKEWEGKYSVCWFKNTSGYTHPGIIYRYDNRSNFTQHILFWGNMENTADCEVHLLLPLCTSCSLEN